VSDLRSQHNSQQSSGYAKIIHLSSFIIKIAQVYKHTIQFRLIEITKIITKKYSKMSNCTKDKEERTTGVQIIGIGL